MKKNAIRILSLLLVVMTLVGVISLPVSAYSYPMEYTIYYKAGERQCVKRPAGFTADGRADRISSRFDRICSLFRTCC